MKKLTVGDPETQSKDVKAENIENLKVLFPEAFTEGKINFDVLKQLLGGAVEEREEKYGLGWHGKRQARQIALTPSTGTLRPCPDQSVDWDKTQNLIIEGDNLEVLKLLQKSYAGKVKLIYIDPPYNTGKDFVYRDNFQDNIKNYLELTGQTDSEGNKISSNSEASGRFHTDWLNMMYPRLKLARSLLKEDGIIFVSIDFRELASLRKVMDEIFGAENLIGIISVVSNWKGRSDDKFIATANEFLVVFQKGAFESYGLPLSEEYLATYTERDETGQPFRLIGLRKRGAGSKRTDRPNMYYPFYVDPVSGRVFLQKNAGLLEVVPRLSDGSDGRWRWGKATAAEYIGTLLARKVSGTDRFDVFEKDYAESAEGPRRAKPKSFWFEKDLANEAGTLEYKDLMGNVRFDNPKPTALIRHCLAQATKDSDLVLDFFAGSGTTAHAVMDANREEGGSRRYILVQLPEPTGRPDFATLSAVTRERVKRVGLRISEELPGTQSDIGFRSFKLDTANIRPWDASDKHIEQHLLDAVEHVRAGRTELDLLWEIALKRGLDLASQTETANIAKKTVYSMGAGTLFACLAESISRADAEPLANGIAKWRKELAPAVESMVVFRDSAFVDDVAKTNLAAILTQHGFTNVRSL